MKAGEFIKKNGKMIVIVILAFFCLKGCVRSCTSKTNLLNRDEVIVGLNHEIDSLKDIITSKDKVISSKNAEIDKLNVVIGQQSSTIERLDRAASKAITVKPADVIIKREDLNDEKE